MKLIIGGAFQGKQEYAEKQYSVKTWIDGRSCAFEELFLCDGIHHFHEYIKRKLKEESSLENLAEELVMRNPLIVIVTNELGYGVVPMEAFDRNYRETTGRICCKLAEQAEEVVRVICGIGTVIKHA